MSIVKALDFKLLYTACDVDSLPFESSSELEDLSDIIGQSRAVSSMHFGVHMKKDGYNLFVLGPPGMGKYTMVRQYLEHLAVSIETPPDWCYVHNFKHPHRPIALRLPPGSGFEFKQDIKHLLEDLRSSLPIAFESKEYRSSVQEIEDSIDKEREEAFFDLENEARRRNIAITRTPSGFVFSPTKNGNTVMPGEFKKLSAEEKKKYEESIDELQDKLNAFIQKISENRRETRNKIKTLNREVAIFGVGVLINDLKDKYSNIPKVDEYLNSYQEDVIDSIDEFRSSEPKANLFGIPVEDEESYRRYSVNLFVDHNGSKGAPVIYEDNPMYHNLVGRIEHVSRIGALETNFTLIKPGALHQANGGYIILDVRKLLTQPYSWEGLKRALYSKKIRIQSLAELFSIISTVSLEAEPIPLDLKVVLLGDRILYYLLLQYDPEFSELFKISADFEEEFERSAENDLLYARMIATLVRKENLKEFDRRAIARIIEFSSRQANDASKLTTHMIKISDLVQEADQWAREMLIDVVDDTCVQRAIDEKIDRVDRMRDKIQEDIQKDTILIDTSSAVVGQINGLSVISLGDFSFALPTRITVTTFCGGGEVVDISREVKLGGAIHSKGVMILSSFFTARFAKKYPLSLSASITFEQTYGKVEGDSASVAELCALMSSLSDVPIKQALAVTGSVNQLGQVQAIGGVNEKIEGFFDTCKTRGLTGEQGVLIPEA
ncbi:MAG: AAA family ATPase, partial [Gammaproteobacteria bacterium]|nr:AAA family ATPase [Gammaproteobacteria bacterium]